MKERTERTHGHNHYQHMCDEQEGGGTAAESGWSNTKERGTLGGWIQTIGAILRSESACVSGADGLLSAGSWGVGAESFLVHGVARSLSHTSPLCLSSTMAFVTLYFV